MIKQELEVYARIRFYLLIKDIKDQSTIVLTDQEAIRLMGIPELIEQTKKET